MSQGYQLRAQLGYPQSHAQYTLNLAGPTRNPPHGARCKVPLLIAAISLVGFLLSAFCSLTTSRSFVVLRCGPLLCSRISLTISFLFLLSSKLQIELFYSALLFSSFKCNGLWPHKTSQFFFFSFLFWLFSNVTACGRTCKSLSFFPWPIFNSIVRPVVAQFFHIFFFSVWLFC